MTLGPTLLLPAAGRGTRLGLATGSKEVLRIDSHAGPTSPLERIVEQAVTHGIRSIRVLTREEKLDVVSTVEDLAARFPAAEIVAQIVPPTASVPETLSHGLRTGRGPWVLAFADIFYRPDDLFASVADELEREGADVVLGLLPTDRADKSDMVELDAEGRISGIWIKEGRHDLRYAWAVAAWGDRFAKRIEALAASDHGASEAQVGNAVRDALGDGLDVRALPFPHGSMLDIGTPDDLQRARSGH